MSDCGEDTCCADDGICDAGDDSDDWIDTDDVRQPPRPSKEQLLACIAVDEKLLLELNQEITVLHHLSFGVLVASSDPTGFGKIRSDAQEIIAAKKVRAAAVAARIAKYRDEIKELERMDTFCCKYVMPAIIAIIIMVLIGLSKSDTAKGALSGLRDRNLQRI